tara:strand:- start:418 stop:597 length:180 start_codon:yes stop_codon:yes gene_type:complete
MKKLEEGFIEKFFTAIAKGRVDSTMKKMMKDDPKVGKAVKDLRAKQKDLDSYLKKQYGI